jgi:hypothetical protein
MKETGRMINITVKGVFGWKEEEVTVGTGWTTRRMD